MMSTVAEFSQAQNGFDCNDTEDRFGKPLNSLTVQRVITKVKQKLGNRKKQRKNGGVEEDFDDNASVSSSLSSASEHSVKTEKKVKKVKKQHCEVHSKSSKTKDFTVDGDPKVEMGQDFDKESGKITDHCSLEVKSQAAEAKCTCRKTSKSKSNKVKVVRPEPEGSILSDLSKVSFLDDLERVIYSNDPIFSDLEDEDPGLEDQIRAESERFHRRITDPENIFSAVQMLNTNTMMKFAIIQTELKNVKDVSLRRSESEIVSAAKRAELLRESFEHTENSFKSVSSQISEASKSIGSLDSAMSLMLGNSGNVNEKKQMLPVEKEQQKVASSFADMSSIRKSFYGRRLLNEVDMEILQCNLEAAEIKILDLEEEQTLISNGRKSRSTTEFEELMRRLSQKLVQAEKQARDTEQVMIYLGKQLDNIQDERLAKKKKHQAISAEINTTFSELSVF